eukprot:4741899-Amphidinium_carterae.3
MDRPLIGFVLGILAERFSPRPLDVDFLCSCDCTGTGHYAPTAFVVLGGFLVLLTQFLLWQSWKRIVAYRSQRVPLERVAEPQPHPVNAARSARPLRS